MRLLVSRQARHKLDFGQQRALACSTNVDFKKVLAKGEPNRFSGWMINTCPSLRFILSPPKNGEWLFYKRLVRPDNFALHPART